MLAKASFNNESSTEVLFPPHQETQMETETISHFDSPFLTAKHLQSRNKIESPKWPPKMAPPL